MEGNNTTSPSRGVPDDQIWQLPVVYIIGILGILGNGTVFLVFLANSKSLKKFSSLYIFHQTIIDFGSSVVFLAYRTHVYYQDRGYLEGESLLDVVTCKLWYSGYLMWAMLLTSNLNLALLSLERYFAVCHSVKHRNKYTVRRVKISMAVIWMIGISYQAFMPIVYQINKLGFCTPQWSSKTVQSVMGVVTFMMQYLIPLTLMSFSYVRIIFQLKMLSISYIRRKRQAASNSDAASQAAVSQIRKDAKTKPRSHSNGVSSGTVTEVCISTSSRARSFLHATLTPIGGATNQSMTPIDTTFNQSQSIPRSTFNQSQSVDDESLPQVRPTRSPTLVMFDKAKHNATRTLWFVFITFIICWTPAQVEYLIDNFENENENCFVDCESTVNAVVTNILLLNMVVNPFIYAISLKEFQENFKRTMSLLKCSFASVSCCCKLRIFPCRRTSFSLQQHDANTARNNHGDVSLVHHHKRGGSSWSIYKFENWTR